MILKTKQGRYRVKVKRKGVIVADKTFIRKRDAEQYEAEKKREVMSGEFIHPHQGQVTLNDLYEEWIDVRKSQVKIRSVNSDESAWRAHIKPQLGNVPIKDITKGDVDRFAAKTRKSVSASTTNRILFTLREF